MPVKSYHRRRLSASQMLQSNPFIGQCIIAVMLACIWAIAFQDFGFPY